MTTREILYDKILQCFDCGHDFIWTPGEQRFYADKGLAPPKRCRHCRKQKRQHFVQKEQEMNPTPGASQP